MIKLQVTPQMASFIEQQSNKLTVMKTKPVTIGAGPYREYTFPSKVSRIRRKYRKCLEIDKRMVAVLNGEKKKAHGNRKVKPGDTLQFIYTHGVIG